MKQIFRVLSQSPVVSVKRQDGTMTQKSTLSLQELGGKYEDSFVVTLLGNMAALTFRANDIVYASLRFTAREYNGQLYQDCTMLDVAKLNINVSY